MKNSLGLFRNTIQFFPDGHARFSLVRSMVFHGMIQMAQANSFRQVCFFLKRFISYEPLNKLDENIISSTWLKGINQYNSIIFHLRRDY